MSERVERAIEALRKPDPSLARVVNTIRFSLADVMEVIEHQQILIGVQADRIEALEAALREIANWPPSTEYARDLARAALAYPESHYVDPANACDDRSIIEAKSQAVLTQERERCIAVCESWIGTFQQFDLKHISTRDYAVDVVEDIIALIREGHDPRAALDQSSICPTCGSSANAFCSDGWHIEPKAST